MSSVSYPVAGSPDRVPRGAVKARTRPAEPAAADTHGLAFSLVQDRAGFDSLEAEWRDLFARAGQSHQMFQCYNWLWHWCGAYLDADAGANGPRLSILVARHQGRAVVIWPLVRNRHMGAVQLTWMGAPVSQYGDVLLDDGPQAQEWLRASWDFLNANLGADLLYLPRVRADAAVAPLLEALGHAPLAEMDAPYVELSQFTDYKAYQAHFSAHMRRNRRRQARRLAEQGPISVEILNDGKAARKVAKQAFAFKREWLKSRALVSSAFADERFDAFFLSALSAPDRPAGCVTFVLRVADVPAAIEICVACKGRYVTHVRSFNPTPEIAAQAPGALLMGEIVANCFMRDVETFDLMAPGDAYKYEWADRAMKVRSYAIPRSTRGKLALVLGHGTRKRIKRAYGALPYGLRKRMLATLSLLD